MKRKGCQNILECNIRTYNAFRRMKREKGITLIALIVTIIVLLILAGISIGALTGDNGILSQSRIAKEDTERKGIEEQINVMVIQSTNNRGNIDKEKLMEKLNTLPEGKEIVESDNKIYVVYPEYSFEIDLETGDVTQPNIEISKDETPWELAGSGTESDPFLVESIEDLVAFSNSVNGGNQYNGKYIKLVNTLDFNLPFSYNDQKIKVSETTTRVITEDENGTELKTFLTSGKGFNPIGGNGKYFGGNFDGNGKVIKNIYIDRQDEDYVGLFGDGGKILKKLGITGEIKGKEHVGGILANTNSSYRTIYECYNKANVSGETYVRWSCREYSW